MWFIGSFFKQSPWPHWTQLSVYLSTQRMLTRGAALFLPHCSRVAFGHVDTLGFSRGASLVLDVWAFRVFLHYEECCRERLCPSIPAFFPDSSLRNFWERNCRIRSLRYHPAPSLGARRGSEEEGCFRGSRR